MQQFVMNNISLFGVCDGHGVNGHFVSEFIKEILPENIEYFSIKSKIFLKEPKPELVEQVLKQAFRKTAIDLDQSCTK
jgi:serine/threonine protein phosphatase PrpC